MPNGYFERSNRIPFPFTQDLIQESPSVEPRKRIHHKKKKSSQDFESPNLPLGVVVSVSMCNVSNTLVSHVLHAGIL